MNTSDSVRLTQPDVIRFRKKVVVVRLYKRQKWYAGFCWKMAFDGQSSFLFLDPYIRIGLGHETAPHHPGACLFHEKDWAFPGSERLNERPFELIGCTRGAEETAPTEPLCVSCIDGTLVLSERECDIKSAEKVFLIKSAYPFELE